MPQNNEVYGSSYVEHHLNIFSFVSSSLVHPAPDGCVRETLTDGLDLIFTDIMGVLIIAQRSGPDYSLHKFVFLCFIYKYNSPKQKERMNGRRNE